MDQQHENWTRREPGPDDCLDVEAEDPALVELARSGDVLSQAAFWARAVARQRVRQGYYVPWVAQVRH